MRVGLDLLHAIPGKSGQVGNLWRNNLSIFPTIDKDIEYIVFVRPRLYDYYCNTIERSQNLKFHICELNSNSPLERIRFQERQIPDLLQRYRCDLFFTGSPAPTFYSKIPLEIFKITGIQFYSRPGEFGWLRSIYHHYTTKRKALRSKYIVVNSQFVKQEILKRIDISGDRLKVIYESLDHRIFNNKQPVEKSKAQIQQKWGIADRFLLYVSDLRPYKNPLSLIKAFHQLKSTLSDYKLVLIGQDINGYKKQLVEYIESAGLSRKVILLGFVEQFNFADLMRAAEIVIYPSSLETFGVIPLEAMACETPVIAGNETAIPEICGDAALLVHGKNHHEIADAILKIVNDDDLRASLIKKGLDRVKKFSWQKNAEETVALFRTAVRKES